jgi:hypothetical protein
MTLKHRKVIATMVLIAVVGAAGGASTWATFDAVTDNVGNRTTSGTVDVTDNDGGAPAMLSFSGALPGESDTGCIKVVYSGSATSDLRLYGATSGTGLDQYLDLKITRGTYTGPDPTFDACTGFQEDTTDYIGAGPGVVYNGTLQGFGDDYATGLADPTPGSPESWTTGESHVYKIQVTLQDNVAAEGKDATQTFTWEARSL